MKSKIVFWIDKGKRTKTITEYICPECEQRYWFTEEGFCIVCGTKLNFYIRLEETAGDTDANLVREAEK